MAKPNVPFKRELQLGDTGEDVLAVKRAIARAGFWKWQQFSEKYHEKFARGKPRPTPRFNQGVAGYKRSQGIKAGITYTKETHQALVATRVPAGKPNAGEWVFDKSARMLYNGFEDISAEEKILTDIYKYWDELVRNKYSVHYSQMRPWKKKDPITYPIWLDCSSTCIYTAWLADAKSPDPVNGFNGYGYTGTLISGGFRIAHNEVERYANKHLILAFYGTSRWNTKHVTSVKSLNKVYSNGSERAPEILTTPYYRGDFIEFRAYEVI